jgi:hypothetical protein
MDYNGPELPRGFGGSIPSTLYYDLGLAIVRIWARVLQGNTSWALVNIIGYSLEIYADLCENGSARQ